MLDVEAISIDRGTDLSDLARYLRQSGLPHRISESGSQQIIWVASTEAADAVNVVYQHWQAGSLPKVEREVRGPNSFVSGLLKALTASPLVLTFIVATMLCYPVTYPLLSDNQIGNWLPLFTLTDFTPMGGQLRFADLEHTLSSGEWWRLVSPMFLHFGWIHIVFNLLWLWELGRRVEVIQGPLALLFVVLATSISANVIQYYMYGVGLVGGMSGVVFGLVGYAMLLSKLKPAIDLGVKPGIFVFMLVYLVVGFTGAVDLLGLGSIANGAHLGGLIGGVICALFYGVFHSFRHSKSQ